jgi:lipid II:glycine glycyltransferase (peptidoglycan interpeptide bridge formation enzyme)
MEIKEITNKEHWEDFLQQCITKTFLQSWNWGEFNTQMGSKIWRFGAYNEDRLVAVALVVKVSAKRGTFLFIPHGPAVIDALPEKDKKEILELLLVRLSEVAKEEEASFVRISPLFYNTQENKAIFEDLGFRNSPMHASAYEATWKLDILQEDILHNMRKTTRYLIKKASENPDISVEITNNPENLQIYQQLNKKVAKRQKFVPFSDQSIKSEFEIFNKDNQAVFVIGKYKGEVAAGALIIFWSGIAFYHQAASDSKFAKYSIPYLMQWEAIKEAEKRGCKIYDFWGFTDPEKFPKHPWAGPTLFKMGFGGYKEEYLETQDFVISSGYWVNYIIEKIRRFKRGV